MTTVEPFIPIAIAVASGGLVAAVVRWRPEATAASVAASDSTVKMIERQLARMEQASSKLAERIAALERALSVEKDARIKAEREAAAMTEKYQSERDRRHEAERALALATHHQRRDDDITSDLLDV